MSDAATIQDGEDTPSTGDTLADAARQLPAWPIALQRVQAVLARDRFDADEAARLVAVDARLVLRIFDLAQSFFFGMHRQGASELPTTIGKLGIPGMRCALASAALANLRASPRLHQVRREVVQLGLGSCTVAAFAWRITAQSLVAIPADALLAGLVHNVGKLALLAQFGTGTQAQQDKRQRVALIVRLQAQLGARIARDWRLPDDVCNAIALQDKLSGKPLPLNLEPDVPSLASVLAAAVVAARTANDIDATAAHLVARSELSLTEAEWRDILREAPQIVAASRAAFGD